MTALVCYWCDEPGRKRGLCDRHYGKARRDGTLRYHPARGPTPRPWPLAPLLEASGLTADSLRDRLRASSTAMDRAVSDGLTDEQADHWAVRCGFHPSLVWGRSWDEAGLGVLDRLHVERGAWRHAWLWRHGMVGDDLPALLVPGEGEAA